MLVRQFMSTMHSCYPYTKQVILLQQIQKLEAESLFFLFCEMKTLRVPSAPIAPIIKDFLKVSFGSDLLDKNDPMLKSKGRKR